MIAKVLLDLPSSRNQPLKSADELYIRILKNKLIIKDNKIGKLYTNTPTHAHI
jgi:hypothetical protein